jgi:hypothetical protein
MGLLSCVVVPVRISWLACSDMFMLLTWCVQVSHAQSQPHSPLETHGDPSPVNPEPSDFPHQLA